jgi:hypothetical protein
MKSSHSGFWSGLLAAFAASASGVSLAQDDRPTSRDRLPPVVSGSSLRQASDTLFPAKTVTSHPVVPAGHQAAAYAAPTYGPASYPMMAVDGNRPYQLASHDLGSTPVVAYHDEPLPAWGGSCGPLACDPCGPPWWAHRTGGFGEVLYLWPGNSDLIYAVEQTDTTATASPTGPLGITNVDEAAGYRVGFSIAKDFCSSYFGSYARWDNDTTDLLQASGQNVLNSRLIHPSTTTVGSQSLQSSTTQSISFQTADFGYRRMVRANECSAIHWLGGLRYGNLEQGLLGQQTVSVATGLTSVTTDIDFDGFGILAGLDGERRSKCCGGLLYGKVVGSLLAGDWRADYRQTNQFGGGVIANHFEDFRVTPTLDAELGFGWMSKGGRVKLTAGYLFSHWFNSVSNRDYLRNVRSGNLEDMADVLTFSGLTSRFEWRF